MSRKKDRKPDKNRAPAAAKSPLPTKEQILKFVKDAPATVGKREIARAFAVKGADRIGLKRLLQELADEGALVGSRKAFKKRGHLPPVVVLEVIARDNDGDLIAEPVVWDEDGPKPRALIVEGPRKPGRPDAALGLGDRVLARITHRPADRHGIAHTAEPIKRVAREQARLLGIFSAHRDGGGEIQPIDRKALRSWSIRPTNTGEAKDGDLVRFDLVRGGRYQIAEARIAEVIGNPADQRQISLIAVHAHGIPDVFPSRVMDEVQGLAPPDLKTRADLRGLPLITIDPSDARDHDDAVHAAPDDDPRNSGGFVVHVAIADVAHYIRPDTALDREARLRGNSCYFPDRVVPMLPERISNDLCSLREAEDRPCLVVRMIIGADGRKRGHTFLRAMMRSAAKLAYQEAQAAIEGRPNDKTAPLLDTVLKPLWQAYAAMSKARNDRSPLDLDVPERRIVLGPDGKVARVIVPERLDAHRLIEEFMIQANVAAAEMLEAKRTACIYRVHAAPSKEKLEALREFLETLDLPLPKDSVSPRALNDILARAKALPTADLVNEVILRSQAQAEYAHENYGHFGLNLQRYAHFTSPIRRYADLVVHRALVRALDLGAGKLADGEVDKLAETCMLISGTERRAMAAERETTDRLIASHLAEYVGAEFDGRITGVTRIGLFIRLKDTGADGLVPISTLGQEYFHHEEGHQMLIGERSGGVFQLGDDVRVRLVEAIATAGALRFEMLSKPRHDAPRPARSIRGRHGDRPHRGGGFRPAHRGKSGRRR